MLKQNKGKLTPTQCQGLSRAQCQGLSRFKGKPLKTYACTVVDVQHSVADFPQTGIHMKPADQDMTCVRHIENHITHRVLHANRACGESRNIVISLHDEYFLQKEKAWMGW